jgi:hypothetical protein
MKVGDLVVHKGTGKTYLIVEDGGNAKALVGVIRECGTLGFMAKSWLEVINESG